MKNKEGKEVVERITEKVTLKIFSTGSDPKNYYLLHKLPLKAKEIEIELNLSPMPANRRINELMEVGLIRREKPGAEIEITPLGKEFIKYIHEMRQEVIKQMVQIV
tara:strand:- start:17365 stop:17682 length:318 start_codon:yes stop_codon:yes gene_type:complete